MNITKFSFILMVNILLMLQLKAESITFNGLEYGIITSPITGKKWLDRNLGATQVCTSSTDTSCYGDYYQWGRLADGHEKANSALSSTQASSITSVGNSFITTSFYPYDDWTTADSNGNQRTAQWSKTDGTGVCPVGFRVPTFTELKTETLDNGVINSATAFSNFLKFPVAGSRGSFNGSLNFQGSWGNVWTNSGYGSGSQDVGFGSSDASWGNDNRAYAFSVRCVEN